jgi:hypothetical protein
MLYANPGELSNLPRAFVRCAATNPTRVTFVLCAAKSPVRPHKIAAMFQFRHVLRKGCPVFLMRGRSTMKSMHWLSICPARYALAAALLTAILPVGQAFCADQTTQVLVSCPPGDTKAPGCTPSKKDLKQAEKAFKHGMGLLQDQHDEEALAEFTQAVHFSPRNMTYATAEAATQQRVVFRYLQQGNQALLNHQPLEAQADFRNALHLDPQNDFAKQRLNDLLADDSTGNQNTATPPAEVIADSPIIEVAPDPAQHEFHFRGDSRQLLTQVASAYGVSAIIDESVVSRHVWFDMGSANFSTAMTAAGNATKTFWSPVDSKQVVVAADTTENHRQFDQMAMRTFYFPGTSSPTALNDINNSLRNVFDVRFLSQGQQEGVIVVRAPQPILDAATQYIQELDQSRPQVMLDINVYLVSHSLVREIGMHIPNNFNLYNIPAAALAALGGQSIQSLINQLASGGLSSANAGGLSALLAQLQSGQGPFSQPLATFGGGLSFSGISLDQLTATLSLNESSVHDLQHAILRAGDNSDAVFKIGERYPILTSSFSTSFSNSAITQLLGSQAGAATGAGALGTPFPSFNYEDIGLNLKAKPSIFSDSSVALAVELALRTIGTQSVNGIPVISNREYKGSIVLKDGEPAVLAGAVSHTEQLSMNGIPGLGAVPLLNKAMVDNSKTTQDDELLIVITPHVIRDPARRASNEIWMAQ